MIRLTTLLSAFLLAVVLSPGPDAAASSDERILEFKSRIVINADSTVKVTETIKVRAAGKQIKRGIYRDFPTAYKDRHGVRRTVGFRVVEVRRDGSPEPYRVERRQAGQRVYIGDKDVFLQHGVYTYDISYVTDRQIGYFDDFDEIYWNVTGNDWAFPIDRVEAVVVLPPGGSVVEKAAYTGHRGATGKDFHVITGIGGSVMFSTTRPLRKKEGLTIAVAWPKGLVRQPTAGEQAGFFFKDNAPALAAVLGFVFILCYYMAVWIRVGRDLPAGTVVPLFEPPQGFSPAAARFVMRMGFDDKAFAAAVVNMAVKGRITIEDDDGEFTLRKTGDTASPPLSSGEKAIDRKLFDGDRSITLKQANHAKIGGAVKGLKKALEGEFRVLHFATNHLWMVPGVLLTVLMILMVALFASGFGFGEETAIALFMSVWLTGWTTACYALVKKAFDSWRDVARGGGAVSWVGAIFGSVFLVPFLGGEIMGLTFLAEAITWPAAVVVLATAVMAPLFYYLLKAPTVMGRAVMDRIEGFKMFMSVAEKDRMNMLHPPDATPELFEKYLPFALSLDVEHEWSEQFATVLAAAGQTPGSYHPHWYSGRSFGSGGVSGLGSSLGGALSSAVASSSSAPGSSGGGSSGGGGGGGGGGGW